MRDPIARVHTGDCFAMLSMMRDDSIGALVSDPPYGLGFMGKEWDKALPDPRVWEAVLRVLKPGAHGVVFGHPRLEHRLTCQLEDAGFEIRDKLQWFYGSGFPKSHNVDDEHGTALKPAYEPIVLVRKPFRGTIEECFREHGTGVLNIGACRIAASDERPAMTPREGKTDAFAGGGLGASRERNGVEARGRWPANVAFDEDAAAQLDEQTGTLRSGSRRAGTPRGESAIFGKMGGAATDADIVGSRGGASRFFYCSKAARSEREAGLDDFAAEVTSDGRKTSIDNPFLRGETKRKNVHPTVKPLDLMRWLVRLVTPAGGTVIDPFAGSVTTGCAAVAEGFGFEGAELEEHYARIARARIEHWRSA